MKAPHQGAVGCRLMLQIHPGRSEPGVFDSVLWKTRTPESLKLQNFNKLIDSLIFTSLTVTLLTGQRLSGQLVSNKRNTKTYVVLHRMVLFRYVSSRFKLFTSNIFSREFMVYFRVHFIRVN